MGWAKLDDGFYRHRKARAAGKDGRALFVAGLCWCGAQLTNGHIAAADLQLLAAEAEVRGQATADRLVEVGLWEAVDDGWVVHDYLDYNPTAEAALAKRKARAEAGRKGGQRSRPPRPEPTTETNGEAIASANEKQIGTPSPSPSLTVESPLSSTTVRDDLRRRDLVEAAVTELGRRDVARAARRGAVARNPERYEAACITARRRDYAAALHELAHEHPDWTEHQLADAIDTAADTTSDVVVRPPTWQPTAVPDAIPYHEQAGALRAAREAVG